MKRFTETSANQGGGFRGIGRISGDFPRVDSRLDRETPRVLEG